MTKTEKKISKFMSSHKAYEKKMIVDSMTAAAICQLIFGDEIFQNIRKGDGNYLIYDFNDGWISDLRDRLEINFWNTGNTYNIWIDSYNA